MKEFKVIKEDRFRQLYNSEELDGVSNIDEALSQTTWEKTILPTTNEDCEIYRAPTDTYYIVGNAPYFRLYSNVPEDNIEDHRPVAGFFSKEAAKTVATLMEFF